MAIVAIVGAGMMGTATAYPLSDNGHQVRLIGTHLDSEIIQSCLERRYHPRLKREIPSGVRPYFVEEMARALDGVDLIIGGVNSLGVRWLGRAIGPYLRPGQMIICVTKGLEADPNGDLRILPDVLAEKLPPSVRGRVTLAAIGGPCIAGELAGRRQTCVVFASPDLAAARSMAGFFRTAYYHVWETQDWLGLEVCVALKNGYAMGVGLAYGLLEREGGPDAAGTCTYNLAAALFAQGCSETERVLRLVGATSGFAFGLPSAGDLFVTVQGGRSMRLGRLLGLGRTFVEAERDMAGLTLEAAEIVRTMGAAIPKLQARGLLMAEDLPFMRALVDVVVHGRPLALPLDAFFHGGALQ
jgi:glycerol-3-phosphate dehydrogenase (NAD(P)+)